MLTINTNTPTRVKCRYSPLYSLQNSPIATFIVLVLYTFRRPGNGGVIGIRTLIWAVQMPSNYHYTITPYGGESGPWFHTSRLRNYYTTHLYYLAKWRRRQDLNLHTPKRSERISDPQQYRYAYVCIWHRVSDSNTYGLTPLMAFKARALPLD